MNLLQRLRQVLHGSKSDEGCHVYCPGCREDLTRHDDSFLNDSELTGVAYCCEKCGTYSRWDFGPPAPILIDTRPLA